MPPTIPESDNQNKKTKFRSFLQMHRVDRNYTSRNRRGSEGGVQERDTGVRAINPLLPDSSFLIALHLEQKRTERSRRRLVLMLLDLNALMAGAHVPGREQGELKKELLAAVSGSIRETDIQGWFRKDRVIGVVFTEIEPADGRVISEVLSAKMKRAIAACMGSKSIHWDALSFYLYPEDWHTPSEDGGPSLAERYPEVVRDTPSIATQRLKRLIDIAGSLAALTFLSPVFLVLAAAVKLTSKGPVIFRQPRVGQYGRAFTFLKFRSMYSNNDSKIHEEYVAQLISGKEKKSDGTTETVFKIKNDPRITPLGRFLRKTSLDELPQFWNVLRGEMSLVGPRPPVLYEVAKYDVWHLHRLNAKPGLTGLWQVEGRSRVRFDDMVRLDLRYTRATSMWLDLKILIKTPKAVVGGGGAY